MIVLITGASHTGKTALAQKLLEKYKYPYLSIDHLKMGLIRSKQTELTPMDDKELTEKYKRKKDLYNQTVSKADQIALCSYIRDGHLNSQIKKSRKIYAQKSKILTDLLAKTFGKNVKILKTNSPLYVKCRFNVKMTALDFCDKAEKDGILVIPVGENENLPEIAFSVATVGQENLEKAVEMLRKVTINC